MAVTHCLCLLFPVIIRVYKDGAIQDTGGRRQRPHAHFLQPGQGGLAVETGGQVCGNSCCLPSYHVSVNSGVILTESQRLSGV